jgi:hypothetical protein
LLFDLMSSSTEVAFESVLAFLQAVKECADAFGPLKSAVGGAVHLMETAKAGKVFHRTTHN